MNEDYIFNELDRLRERVDELEGAQDTQLHQVKDIMTVFENRVLGEIKHLTDSKIEPQEKIVSALMVTISDIFIKFSAFIDVFEDEATPEFREKVRERTKYWQQETIGAMRQFDEAVTIQDATKDSPQFDDRKSGNTDD